MCCCMAVLVSLTTDSWAATRAYVMNGLFVGTGHPDLVSADGLSSH
jgi:hypothetical protein